MRERPTVSFRPAVCAPADGPNTTATRTPEAVVRGRRIVRVLDSLTRLDANLTAFPRLLA